jgi:26S proteasome regulatory subunit N6
MASSTADDAKRIEEAQKQAKEHPAKAEETYKNILSKDPGSNEAAVRNYETALKSLGELYRDQKRVDDLAELVRTTCSTLSSFAKAKTAKLGTVPDLTKLVNVAF